MSSEMNQLTDDELIELFDRQLPDLLERRPLGSAMKTYFARR